MPWLPSTAVGVGRPPVAEGGVEETGADGDDAGADGDDPGVEGEGAALSGGEEDGAGDCEAVGGALGDAVEVIGDGLGVV